MQQLSSGTPYLSIALSVADNMRQIEMGAIHTSHPLLEQQVSAYGKRISRTVMVLTAIIAISTFTAFAASLASAGVVLCAAIVPAISLCYNVHKSVSKTKELVNARNADETEIFNQIADNFDASISVLSDIFESYLPSSLSFNVREGEKLGNDEELVKIAKHGMYECFQHALHEWILRNKNPGEEFISGENMTCAANTIILIPDSALNLPAFSKLKKICQIYLNLPLHLEISPHITLCPNAEIKIVAEDEEKEADAIYIELDSFPGKLVSYKIKDYESAGQTGHSPAKSAQGF